MSQNATFQTAIFKGWNKMEVTVSWSLWRQYSRVNNVFNGRICNGSLFPHFRMQIMCLFMGRGEVGGGGCDSFPMHYTPHYHLSILCVIKMPGVYYECDCYFVVYGRFHLIPPCVYS